MKEWSPLNDKSPTSVTRNYKYPVLWRCPVCRGDYNYIVAQRRVGDDACPFCNGRRVKEGYNSLLDTDPELAKEWSPLNERTPNSVTKDFKLSVLWKCPTCHGDYFYSVAERSVGDNSCPYCNKGRFLKEYNSFANKYPDMLDEWDYISNYLICSPYDIADYSQEKVWWKCSKCGKRYELSPKAKIMFNKRQMESCIYCKGNRRKLRRYW